MPLFSSTEDIKEDRLAGLESPPPPPSGRGSPWLSATRSSPSTARGWWDQPRTTSKDTAHTHHTAAHSSYRYLFSYRVDTKAWFNQLNPEDGVGDHSYLVHQCTNITMLYRVAVPVRFWPDPDLLQQFLQLNNVLWGRILLYGIRKSFFYPASTSKIRICNSGLFSKRMYWLACWLVLCVWAGW